MLEPVDVKAQEVAKVGVDAKVCDKALEFANALFAVEMAHANASEPFGSISDGAREMLIETHVVEEGRCCSALDGVELVVGKVCHCWDIAEVVSVDDGGFSDGARVDGFGVFVAFI